MRGYATRRHVVSKRLWRPLVSVFVAYAVAIQSMMIGLAGFSMPADARQSAPAFELCLHDTAGAPTLPNDKPEFPGCTHCIFCFAGAHHAVIGTAPAVFRRVIVGMIVGPSLTDASGPGRLTRYTIAIPRGPPPSA